MLFMSERRASCILYFDPDYSRSTTRMKFFFKKPCE